jgi:hypothetical protein
LDLIPIKRNVLEQSRDVKVVMFWEKARNPFAGKVCWLEILSNVSFFNGKQEILRRCMSRLQLYPERSRELRLVNLLRRRSRKWPVASLTMSENRTVGTDGEELFGGKRKRIPAAALIVVFVDESQYNFPTLIM